jgi:hypothetical protein
MHSKVDCRLAWIDRRRRMSTNDLCARRTTAARRNAGALARICSDRRWKESRAGTTLARQMAILIVFVLGIVNFAAHRAVLESGHPLVDAMPRLFQRLGGRMSLVVEFVMLLGSMWMVSAGSNGWALAYTCYTGVNGLAAWLILSGRA